MSDFSRTEQTGRNWLLPGTTVAAAMLREAESWANAQGELLSGMEKIWCDWIKRQSEALDAGSRSLQQMFDCRNPVDLVQIQQQWVAETLRRTASHITSLASDTLAVTKRVGDEARFDAGDNRQTPRRGAEPARPNEPVAPQRAAAE